MNNDKLPKKLDLKMEDQLNHAALIRAYGLLHSHTKKAIEELGTLANQGSVPAMIYLGDVYNHGELVTRDWLEAERWYRQSVEAGSARGRYNLGRLLLKMKREEEAVKQFSIAAEADFVPAIHMMGRAYYFGYGVRPDKALAKKYLECAIERGSIFAKRLMAYDLLHNPTSLRQFLEGLLMQAGCYVDVFIAFCAEGASSDRFK